MEPPEPVSPSEPASLPGPPLLEEEEEASTMALSAPPAFPFELLQLAVKYATATGANVAKIEPPVRTWQG
jgi:hypothetical protein